MSTLLLRLAGPLQAWGCDSRFDTRRTGREPSKSGVIGLLAAALGRKRDAPLDDLVKLRFGVRVDKEGELLCDYHTARTQSGKSYVTHRYYLSDATFLVGLESDDETQLQTLQAALNHPAFSLYLGRRSCVPVLPLVVGIRQTNLMDALREEPWQLTPWMQKKEERKGHHTLRLMTDASPDDRYVALSMDLPVSFHPDSRRYAYRPAREHSPVVLDGLMPGSTTHDAMGEL